MTTTAISTEETAGMTPTVPTEAPTETTTDAQHLIETEADSSNPALEAEDEAVNAEGSPDDTPEKPPCVMKFTVKQNDLLRVLVLVMKAESRRSTLPVLSHVLVATRNAELEGFPAQVAFTCSNLETAISWQCDAEVERAGAFTIPAKPLLECVKTFSKGKRITVEVIEQRVHVQCGKRVFKLKGGMDASEFPMWNEMILGEGAPFALDTDILRQAIKEVQFAAADDDPRPLLNSVCMHIQEEHLSLAALDGFRMAVRTITMPTKIGKRDAAILVPVASMRLLAEVMPEAVPVIVMWDKDKKQAVFQAGLVQVAAQLVEGVPPNYSAIIPKENTASFAVPRKELDQVVKAFKLFAQDNANIFKLSYNAKSEEDAEKGKVSCLAESEDLGEAYDEIDVPIEGTDGQIIFNIRYLIDVLKHVPVDSFVFKLTQENKPGLITPLGRQDYSFVVMPMSRNH
ncbi:MAG TPA: DNA polymerase III subunit beta [Ktedonobacteraceae bacterium]|nr:DNA polymerase III subunit beta [Ktedonobacteraceae bacterium]